MSEPIVLNSSAPISTKTGWCKWGYIISLLLIPVGVGIVGLILVFIIDHFKMSFHKSNMRTMKFKFTAGINADEIYKRLQPELVKKYGDKFEFDRNEETISIKYNGIIYDINLNEDNTFSLWWRKSIAGALFSWNEWKEYKKIRTGTALVAYELQKAFDIK